MTITTTVHVNGRYQATVKRNDEEPVVVHGNYEGSPNPSGARSFCPGDGVFDVSEKQVPYAQTIEKGDVGNVSDVLGDK